MKNMFRRKKQKSGNGFLVHCSGEQDFFICGIILNFVIILEKQR